jgi:anhydro-N-acetylmuramic acid kinase
VKVVCTGGGANNNFLLDLLNQQKDTVSYIIPDENIISFKEAIIFAFLGLKYMENIDNCPTGIGGLLVKGNLPIIRY